METVQTKEYTSVYVGENSCIVCGQNLKNTQRYICQDCKQTILWAKHRVKELIPDSKSAN